MSNGFDNSFMSGEREHSTLMLVRGNHSRHQRGGKRKVIFTTRSNREGTRLPGSDEAESTFDMNKVEQNGSTDNDPEPDF